MRPTQCTLVPDPPDVLTSNAGWNLKGDVDWLEDVLQQLHDNGIRTSLFLEPDTEQVRRAKDIGTDRIELYTEHTPKRSALPRVDECTRRIIALQQLHRKFSLGSMPDTILT